MKEKWYKLIRIFVFSTLLAGSVCNLEEGVQAKHHDHQAFHQSIYQTNCINPHETVFTSTFNSSFNYLDVTFRFKRIQGVGLPIIHFQLQADVNGEWMNIEAPEILDQGEGGMANFLYETHPNKMYRFKIINLSDVQIETSVNIK